MGRVYSGTRLSNLEICLEVLPSGTAEYTKSKQPKNIFDYFYQTFRLDEAAEYAVRNVRKGWGEYPAIVSSPEPARQATIFPNIPVMIDRVYVLRVQGLEKCGRLLYKLPSIFFRAVRPEEALALAKSAREKKEAEQEKWRAQLYS